MASKKELQARVEALEAEEVAMKTALLSLGEAVQAFHTFAGVVTDRLTTIEKFHGEEMREAVRVFRAIGN